MKSLEIHCFLLPSCGLINALHRVWNWRHYCGKSLTPNVSSHQCTTASPSVFVEVLICIVLAPVKEDSFLLYSSAQSILPHDKLPNMTWMIIVQKLFFHILFKSLFSLPYPWKSLSYNTCKQLTWFLIHITVIPQWKCCLCNFSTTLSLLIVVFFCVCVKIHSISLPSQSCPGFLA